MAGEQQVASTLTDEWAWSDAHALAGAVDIAIIGGGIVGVSAAYFLAREGLSVALFEKGRIAGEQSGATGAGYANRSVRRSNCP